MTGFCERGDEASDCIKFLDRANMKKILSIDRLILASFEDAYPNLLLI
jgi:hypothetical protein